MLLAPEKLYHLYNRGNNRQPIFFQEKNYYFFKRKACKELTSQIDILAYCLMPNHFHFLINTKAAFDQIKFSNALRTLLSSYTRAIQKQEKMTGSLFQQNSKTKELHTNQYALTCFHYIHQNPLRAGLTNSIEGWQHQSFEEYWKGREEICNISLGRELLDISNDSDQFFLDSIKMISEKLILELF